jgi:hypothetical protein
MPLFYLSSAFWQGSKKGWACHGNRLAALDRVHFRNSPDLRSGARRALID